MIKNKETYCVVPHKIIRELGATEAIIYSTIVGLLRKTDGIGDVSNQTLMDMCGINNKMSLNRYIGKLIESGYIEKRAGDGRGNISIYYVTKKGNNLLPFSDKKGNKNDIERVTKIYKKGNNLLPINKGYNKEINKEYPPLTPPLGEISGGEEEDREIFLNENNNNSNPVEEVSFDQMEQQAIEDVKNIFAKSDDEKAREESAKESFAEFWSLFNPEEAQKCKYKVAQNYWCNEMEEYRRAAALKVLKRGMKSNEKNPFFFLQHFSPVRFFLTKENDQYRLSKDGAQLCRVRWKDEQRIIAAYWADVFELEILDDHFEKRFLSE